MQVSLQFFDREKRPAKGWLGGKLGGGQDDRQFWEAWVINLAVAPSTAAQHYQGTPPTGTAGQSGRLLLSYPVTISHRVEDHACGLASLRLVSAELGLACIHGRHVAAPEHPRPCSTVEAGVHSV